LGKKSDYFEKKLDFSPQIFGKKRIFWEKIRFLGKKSYVLEKIWKNKVFCEKIRLFWVLIRILPTKIWNFGKNPIIMGRIQFFPIF
jgi:hypothetical protein